MEVESAVPALPDLDEGEAASIRLARQQGLIDSAKAVFAALHASDFRIAPAVIHTVLGRCGESVTR